MILSRENETNEVGSRILIPLACMTLSIMFQGKLSIAVGSTWGEVNQSQCLILGLVVGCFLLLLDSNNVVFIGSYAMNS